MLFLVGLRDNYQALLKILSSSIMHLSEMVNNGRYVIYLMIFQPLRIISTDGGVVVLNFSSHLKEVKSASIRLRSMRPL